MYKILRLGKIIGKKINNYYKQHTFAIKTIAGSTLLCSTIYSTNLYINYNTHKKIDYNTQQQIYNLVQDICYKNVSISVLDNIQINKYINKIYNKSTLLNIACKNNNLELVKYLVEHGADVNMHDEIGYISLHSVLLNDSPDINVIKYLVEHGADVDAIICILKNPDLYVRCLSTCVLHMACKHDNLEIVEYLIANGAYIYRCNINDEYPLDIAKKHNCKKLITFFSSPYEIFVKYGQSSF